MLAAILPVLFSVPLVHSIGPTPGPYDPRSLCPGVCPIRRPPGSAEGIYWGILATNSSTGECGLFNNQCPCKCMGFKLCSYFSPPYIPNYNQTTFGYSSVRRCYDEQFQDVELFDLNSPWMVQRVTDQESGVTFISAILDTDDNQSFFVGYICNLRTPEGDPYVFVASRGIRGLRPEHQRRVDAVLRANNICPEKLIVVNRRNCPRYL